MFRDLTYGPFYVSIREDERGEWLCTATVNGVTLVEAVPYHQLSMAVFLLDEVVAKQLGMEDEDEYPPA